MEKIDTVGLGALIVVGLVSTIIVLAWHDVASKKLEHGTLRIEAEGPAAQGLLELLQERLEVPEDGPTP